MISRESKPSTKPRSNKRGNPGRGSISTREADLVDSLHPALADWFRHHFPALSEIQREALPHTLRGENTLVLAPTGSGKTLAAFLSVLSKLAFRASKCPAPECRVRYLRFAA